MELCLGKEGEEGRKGRREGGKEGKEGGREGGRERSKYAGVSEYCRI